MSPNQSHIAGLELALQQWNNGGPAAYYAAQLRGLIEQANAEHSERVREADEGDRPGYDALWLSFGLSRAAWVTLPRVMMHDMPDAWQADMARLLDEWDSTWVNQPNIGSRVQIVDSDGRLVKTPAWVLNYRHPDLEQLASMRAAAPSAGSPGGEV